jgi:hypothetical protein
MQIGVKILKKYFTFPKNLFFLVFFSLDIEAKKSDVENWRTKY